MARPKKIQTPASTDLSKVGVVVPEESGTVEGTVAAFKQIMEQMPDRFQRGDIIQVVPHDKEMRHPLMANLMIVHEIVNDGQKLVCYQPGKNGHPAKRVVDASDALAVGQAKLKFPADKQLPEAERPRYDDPLDKI